MSKPYATYTAKVSFNFTLSLSDAQAEVLRDALNEMIFEDQLPEEEDAPGVSSTIHDIYTTLQESIQASQRLGLVARQPVDTKYQYPIPGGNDESI